MPDFYTDNQGRVRPITGKKGKTVGAVAAAAVVTGLMTAAGGGSVYDSVGAALDSAASQSANAKTTSSQKGAREGNEAEVWRRMALKEINKAIRRNVQCVVQSYGQVQQFFLHNPCDSLHQKLFALSDAQGNIIVVSVAWVKLSSDSSALQFRQLEDTYATGDVTPIATQVLQLEGIRFTAQHYKSRRDGSLVVIAETEPVRGQPSTTLLNDIAKVTVLLPPP